jgi:hypothetical protein
LKRRGKDLQQENENGVSFFWPTFLCFDLPSLLIPFSHDRLLAVRDRPGHTGGGLDPQQKLYGSLFVERDPDVIAGTGHIPIVIIIGSR